MAKIWHNNAVTRPIGIAIFGHETSAEIKNRT